MNEMRVVLANLPKVPINIDKSKYELQTNENSEPVYSKDPNAEVQSPQPSPSLHHMCPPAPVPPAVHRFPSPSIITTGVGSDSSSVP